MKTYPVKLLHFDSDTEFSAVICADEAETSDIIRLKITIQAQKFTSENQQYLDAYQQLRDKLSEAGYGLKCNGSLINANQSAMMAYVPKIYLIQMGRQARLKDIVSLWDYCETDTFPTTEEQKAFTAAWQDSLKK